MNETTKRPLIETSNGNREPVTPLDQNRALIETQNIDLSWNTALLFPNHSNSLQEEYDFHAPLVAGITKLFVEGVITEERLVDLLTKAHAMGVDGGKIDDLSGELKKEHFLAGLQKTINRISKPHKDGEPADSLTQTIDLIFLDLVNFKNVNDTHDQEKGDEVLKAATNKFRELFPNSRGYSAARIGDEFIFFGVRPKNQPLLHGLLQMDPSQPPTELIEIKTDTGSIHVYYHVGVSTYDPTIHYTSTTQTEGKPKIVSGATKLLSDGERSMQERKDINQAKFPHLYMDRRKIADTQNK